MGCGKPESRYKLICGSIPCDAMKSGVSIVGHFRNDFYEGSVCRSKALKRYPSEAISPDRRCFLMTNADDDFTRKIVLRTLGEEAMRTGPATVFTVDFFLNTVECVTEVSWRWPNVPKFSLHQGTGELLMMLGCEKQRSKHSSFCSVTSEAGTSNRSHCFRVATHVVHDIEYSFAQTPLHNN